ncbi:MAG: MerR family transcriptional regulator [Bacteroidetes bacterium]|jgi:DNA-binding transcriptional MerR regulator|nr:MerR family transcriptional regulator [Bacteroidota bacterium]MBU6330823.1 MerR family transcriptional regulator [Bacteroidota bacterium]
MPYKPYILEKKYYTIGEVAVLLDVNATVLRFWEKQFSAIKPSKNRKGNRVYTQADIHLLEKVRHLVKDKGFTLKGAAEQLQQKPLPTETDPKHEILVRLVKVKGFLETLKKELGR